MGSDGKPMRCFKCESEYHMRDRCNKLQNKEKRDSSKDKKMKKKEKKEDKTEKKKETVMLMDLLKD